VKLFFWKKQKEFFTEEEKKRIVNAVRDAEKMTSGEVRVFIESRCKYMDAFDRAQEIFYSLKMDKTEDRNGVLVYIAMDDHQLAIFGDEGIDKRVGKEYWRMELTKMIEDFNRNNCAEAIRKCVADIGEALHTHFPYNNDTDKNELPDDIVFGH
jgi:uncharacterized membrane protein